MDDLSPRVNHSYTSSTARTNASSVPEPCLRSYAITQTRGFFSNAFQTSPSLLSSFSVFKPSSTERIRILLQPPDIHLVNVQANTEGVSDLMRILQNFETKLPDVLTLIHSGQGINQVDQQGKCVLMYAVDTWLRAGASPIAWT